MGFEFEMCFACGKRKAIDRIKKCKPCRDRAAGEVDNPKAAPKCQKSN